MKKTKRKKNGKKHQETTTNDEQRSTIVEPDPQGQPDTADADVAVDSVEPVDPMAELQQRVASLEDALLRAKADYQNLLRRSATQQADAVRYANAELMKSLIIVADDFDRAIAASSDTDDPAAMIDGMKLVYDNFTKALRDHGLEYVPALHDAFDPAIHEALLHQPTDAHEPNIVVEEVAKGYRLRDRVIRPAKVVVSKAKDDPVESGA